MRNALTAGMVSGLAGLLTFLILHHLWIWPIWFILPMGLAFAALGGLAVGWSYHELRPGLPPAPWTALAVMLVVAATLAPASVLAELRAPLLDIQTGGVPPGSNLARVAAHYVVELVLTSIAAGGILGWWLGRSWKGAVSTALAGLIFALGPGHNIPLLGSTPYAVKGLGLLAIIIGVSAVMLVAGQAALAARAHTTSAQSTATPKPL